MILPNPEVLLLAAMVGLYLYDSMKLLHANEGVLGSSLGGRWAAFFGSELYTLRGKQPFLPNPLLPHRPIFSVRWRQDAAATALPRWTPPALGPYKVLSVLVWLMALGLFGLVPVGLFSRLGVLATAAGIVMFYFSALLALGYVWLRRSLLQLTSRQVVALAFESLTCPPFALNMVRHISWRSAVTEDLLSAARRLLREQDWADTLPAVIARLGSAMEREDEGTPRAQALAAHQLELKQELESCLHKKSSSS